MYCKNLLPHLPLKKRTAGESGTLLLLMQPDPATLEILNTAETDCSPSKAELREEGENELQTLCGLPSGSTVRHFTLVLIINKIS